MKAEIEPIRAASREIVRELHLLDGKMCIDGFSISECHLLSELNALGQAYATELGERLVLDKSTISRLVNSMLKKGYLKSSSDSKDARRRLLSLSVKGKQGLQRINTFSNRQVDQALDYVTPADRQLLVENMSRYAKSLRYARLGQNYRIRPMRRSDNPAVARTIRQVMTEFGAVGCGYSINDAEVDAMFEAYPSPQTAFYVIEHKRKVLGCGGFAPLAGGEAGICELRKMYFYPELRGTGMGSRLLSFILQQARSTGYTLCYLETIESMAQARTLYLKYGFKPRKSAMGETGHSSCNSFMTLALQP